MVNKDTLVKSQFFFLYLCETVKCDSYCGTEGVITILLSIYLYNIIIYATIKIYSLDIFTYMYQSYYSLFILQVFPTVINCILCKA